MGGASLVGGGGGWNVCGDSISVGVAHQWCISGDARCISGGGMSLGWHPWWVVGVEGGGDNGDT